MYEKLRCLATIWLLTTSILPAQLTHWGTVGGAFKFQTERDVQFNKVLIDLDIDLGLFLSENFLLGGGFSIFINNSRPHAAIKQQTSTLMTGNHLFSRYYFYNTEDFRAFAGALFDWNRFFIEKGTVGLGNAVDQQFNQVQISAGLGANYFLQKDIALETALYLRLYDQHQPASTSYSNRQLLDFSVGMHYFPLRNVSPLSNSRSTNYLHPALRQHTWSAGGHLSFSDTPAAGSSLMLSPELSYFPLDRLAVLVRSNLSMQFDSMTHRLSAGAHTRYHFTSSKNYFFLSGGLRILDFKNGSTITPTPDYSAFNTTQLLAVYGVGIGGFLSNTTALEGQLEYAHNLYAPDRPDYSSVRASIGLKFFWPIAKL